MKNILIITMMSVFLGISCSEDKMDEINRDRNNAQEMKAQFLLPDLLLKSFFETAATDIAWYTTVYSEHNAGTWNQSSQADRRQGQESASLFNNSWNGLYDVMNIAKTIINKTDPENGDEVENYWCRAIAQIMMAYNLSVAVDMWGNVPYSEAFLGIDNVQPIYDEQPDLYVEIQSLLDEAIANLEKTTTTYISNDLIYGGLVAADNISAWIKVAYSLKARYYLRLTKVDNTAAQKALDAVADGFKSEADQLILDGFVVDLPGANPWGEFWYIRDHLSVSSTIYDIMNSRNDTLRMDVFFNSTDEADIAPIGDAEQTQGGYAQSNYTSGWDALAYPIFLFSYPELKFIEAEAAFRTAAADWQDILKEAVVASFELHGLIDTAGGIYFTAEVLPRLTVGNELNEIITQKYISAYDREAIEPYNDYRRTGIPEMKNPNNVSIGYVNRFPYALSEVSSNPDNVPEVNIFNSTVFWADVRFPK